jgi:cellulose biosynthesis protein BcsQ
MPTAVFANRKGGVGKTVSTFYAGRWLARAGRDVTLVDLDPQRGLWDIAALLGRPDGVITKRLRLSPNDGIPVVPRGWVLVDAPPALDGSLPALNEADYLVIPVIPEAQEVAQLTKFLTMLEDTHSARPFTRVLGILPVRYIKQWPSNQAMVGEIHTLAERFGHSVLEPVPFSRAVSTFSLRGGLWRQVANRLMAQEGQQLMDRARAA